MNKAYKKILKAIKDYENIVVLRHDVPDFDASGSQFGLATWIKDNYPTKNVYACGKTHKFFSPSLYPATDEEKATKDDVINKKYLLIIVDVANKPRVDGKEYIDKWNQHEMIQAVPGGQYWFNIIQKNIDKGVALRELMEMYNIAPEEVIAIGDNMNDMGMLTCIPNSVAIGNAREEVKAVCKYVADTNANDGVLQILKKL